VSLNAPHAFVDMAAALSEDGRMPPCVLSRSRVISLVLGASLACWLLAASTVTTLAQADGTMQVTSATFNDGDYLPLDHILSADFGFGCAGGNKSPQLAWSGAPGDTKSFAVTVFDPDAPTGSGFWHWVVVNIPPTVSELALDAGNPKANSLPRGARQIRTDFGAPGFGGPCPPAGDHPHRYIFTVFAVGLDQLQITDTTTPAVVGFMLHFNTLAKAELMGLYKH
jgi:Raf kinase inhibitor-like YbhB/YbcL family protein